MVAAVTGKAADAVEVRMTAASKVAEMASQTTAIRMIAAVDNEASAAIWMVSTAG